MAISKRRFRLRLPHKNSFEGFRKFRVRFRNGAPAQDFLKTRIRNPSGSISKWRSGPGLPQKRTSELLRYDFEMALPPKTSSKTEFETLLVQFRNGAPAQDFLKNIIITPRLATVTWVGTVLWSFSPFHTHHWNFRFALSSCKHEAGQNFRSADGHDTRLT